MTDFHRFLSVSYKRELTISLLFFLSFFSTSVTAQYTGCFNRFQVLKMQKATLTEMTSFMQTENWNFLRVNERTDPAHFGIDAPVESVAWTRGDDSESIFFYDNGIEENFVLIELNTDCYSRLFSEFSTQTTGVTSIRNNTLITSFVLDKRQLDFYESSGGAKHTISLYNQQQLASLKQKYSTIPRSAQSQTQQVTKEQNNIGRNNEQLNGVKTSEEVQVGQQENLEPPVSFAQEMPQYPGGELQMQKDIMENVPYPEMEKENNIQGKVYVQFVVEKDGSVSNVRVQRGVPGGPNLSMVAVNAVRKLKRFTSAKNNGRPVRLLMTFPVNFTLK